MIFYHVYDLLHKRCSNVFFQAEDGIRDLVRSRGLGDVYKRQGLVRSNQKTHNKLKIIEEERPVGIQIYGSSIESMVGLSLIHI
mgnify:CR=1 FL=1